MFLLAWGATSILEITGLSLDIVMAGVITQSERLFNAKISACC